MAQKVVTIYTDDLTGEETREASTHVIALDGVEYELDLSPESYDKLWEAIEPFATKGRKRRGSRRSGTRKSSQSSPDTAKIREWAKAEGYEVSERGRVPATIREAYEKAH